MNRSKRVLCPVEKPNGKTWWMSIGNAHINRDGSTNVYLSAYPTNGVLQIRDWDERDSESDESGSSDDRSAPF